MTFQRQLDDLTLHVAAVVLPRAQLPQDDLPVALAGHRALVLLLQHLRPTAGMTRHAASAIEDVEGNPVVLLDSLLARHPIVAEISPIDAQVALADSQLGVHWQQIGRHATVAVADWDAAGAATRPGGAAAWTIVGHVAALSRALAVLDADLGRALADHGRREDAAALTLAATSGLRTTAASVLDLAVAGTLPRTQVVPAPTRAIRVSRAAAVPAGQDRLAILIADPSVELHPADVALISRLQWRSATQAAKTLASGGYAQVAAGLTAYAHALADVPAALVRTASIRGHNPAAVAQARQLHDHLTRGGDAQPVVAGALGFARHARDVAAALHIRARSNLDSGHWLTVNGSARPGELWWARPRPGTPHPAVDQLGRARRATRSWAPLVDTADSPRPQPAWPQLAELARAVDERLRPQRPPSPTDRPEAVVRPESTGRTSPTLSGLEVALLERFAAGTPRAEIAGDLAVSVGTVSDRLSHILAKLRDDGMPPRTTGYQAGRTAKLAEHALGVVSALADTDVARRGVERLIQTARPGPGHGEELRQAQAALSAARRRLAASRQRITPRTEATSRSISAGPAAVPKPDGAESARRRIDRSHQGAFPGAVRQDSTPGRPHR